jgi:glycosyltransferase involved in cell wall biosynthesis
MNATVALEFRFDRTPDGAIWTQLTYAYPFWKRYLEVFDEVIVVARVRNISEALPGSKRADGERVSFIQVPYYIGPIQYLIKAIGVKKAVKEAIDLADAVILRVPGQISNCMTGILIEHGWPYAVEVVGDPYDVFAPGSIKHILRPFLRWHMRGKLRKQCAHACAAAYVTKYALQERYPCALYSEGISDVEISSDTLLQQEAYTTHFSSVELPKSSYVLERRYRLHESKGFKIVTVGSLEQLYKAHDVLIDAVAASVQMGLNIDLVLIGDGKYKKKLQERAERLGLINRAKFLGQLPAGQAVREQLDAADLFALPSKTEGLPRAMIEAMARALPCVGSTVGGIPELLPPEDMVPPGDVAALIAKIREILTNPDRMIQMSARNLEKAKEFRDDILTARRIAFYQHVRRKTEAWLHLKRS